MEKLWREINNWEVNKINYKDCRAAADCLRTLGFEQDKNQIRNEFRVLSNLYDNFRDLKVLSMGMSGDYQIGIEEGSTMIRIGSKIFGERNF